MRDDSSDAATDVTANAYDRIAGVYDWDDIVRSDEIDG